MVLTSQAIGQHNKSEHSNDIFARLLQWLKTSLFTDLYSRLKVLAKSTFKVKVKVVDLYNASTRNVSKALRYSTHCQGITQFYLHTFHPQAEWAIPGFAFPAAAGTHLSTPEGWKAWCEVATDEIRTRNLPIANPELYPQLLAHLVQELITLLHLVSFEECKRTGEYREVCVCLTRPF